MARIVVAGKIGEPHAGHGVAADYDLKVPEQVDAASKTFAELMVTGKYLAFAVAPENGGATGGGMKRAGKQIREFDALAEEIVLVPALAGG